MGNKKGREREDRRPDIERTYFRQSNWNKRTFKSFTILFGSCGSSPRKANHVQNSLSTLMFHLKALIGNKSY